MQARGGQRASAERNMVLSATQLTLLPDGAPVTKFTSREHRSPVVAA